MKPLIVLLTCSFLSSVSTDEESCVGRCELGFTTSKKCQCDSLCRFYSSCCNDYNTVCKKARGDVFLLPDDEYVDLTESPTADYDYVTNGTVEPQPESVTETLPDPEPELEPEPEPEPELEPEPEPEPELEPEPEPEPELEPEPEPEPELEPESEPEPEPEPELEPEPEPEPELEPESEPEPEPEPELEPESEPELEPEPGNICISKQPFDAFTDLKNGSIFAFQGEYFYELDKVSIVPGYPKLIRDVWGIHGPVDSAFTRINCEGKTYIFKDDSYWRFNNGILENGFPQLIKLGFPGIPTNIDAALALPASNINGKERVYFFKGNLYWEYVFQHQPSQWDCAGTSISVPFERYTQFLDDSWEDFFSSIFGVSSQTGTSGPHSISRNWRGIPDRVDSAMIGKLFLIRNFRGNKQRKGKHLRRNRKRGQWRKYSSSMDMDLYTMVPSQSVYFFVKGNV
ncbi:vitronectin-like [Heterodontus francisci]|uniref:vitronectin-like n=1 Tax=Heterodontus francisci TaxID=7792 RepID=UPI00355B050B